MPEAAFEIVGDSGHSANEPGTRGEHDRGRCKWRVSLGCAFTPTDWLVVAADRLLAWTDKFKDLPY